MTTPVSLLAPIHFGLCLWNYQIFESTKHVYHSFHPLLHLHLLAVAMHNNFTFEIKTARANHELLRNRQNRRFFIQPLFVAPNYHQRLVVHSKWNEWLCTDSRPENQTYTCVLIKANPLLEQNLARQQQQRCRH